jgi:transposase
MHVEPHVPETELDRLIAREKHAVRAKRLRAVRLALAGLDAPTVAVRTGYSRRSVQTWVARYNATGLPGLEDAPGRGARPPLDAGQEARFRARVEAGPTPADGVATLRGEDFRRVLKDEFGVVRSLGAVYYLLHRLGYSSLAPRPRHPKGNPEGRAAFQKSSRTS